MFVVSSTTTKPRLFSGAERARQIPRSCRCDGRSSDEKPADGLKFGCRSEILQKQSWTGAGVPACALSSASFQSNDLPSGQAPVFQDSRSRLSSGKGKKIPIPGAMLRQEEAPAKHQNCGVFAGAFVRSEGQLRQLTSSLALIAAEAASSV